ncbi:MAG TPA: SpoIID/LytB domain-containing protein [Gemmatimonadota bacterium]|nr:SpoIID/LytB domain-containing protein [Gemmatimonadota bacterium]
MAGQSTRRSAPGALRGRFFLSFLSLLLGVVGCSGVRRPPDPPAAEIPPAPRFAAEPTIRVGVAWGDSGLMIGGNGRWWIRESARNRPIAVVEGGAAWRVVRLPFETALRVARADGYLSQPHPGPLTVAPLGPFPVELGGTAYPGSIEILLRPDGTLTAVNVAPIETYLEGVVPKELGRPGADAIEALRAQAIAARTYALKRLGSRAALGFDVYGTIQDQAYLGHPDPADSLAIRAVRATRGEALLYNGYLIDAYYHSTCGGHTARVEQVFDDPAAPYLTAVSDERPEGGYWCQSSKYFRWTAAYDSVEIQATIARNLPALVPVPPGGVGAVRDVEVVRSTPEGRALTVQVATSTGRYLVSENEIRTLFADTGGTWLRSTLFLMRAVRDGSRLVGLTLVGGGWGHGVGMCQVGAMARARAGQPYGQILETYYPGATIARLY